MRFPMGCGTCRGRQRRRRRRARQSRFTQVAERAADERSVRRCGAASSSMVTDQRATIVAIQATVASSIASRTWASVRPLRARTWNE